MVATSSQKRASAINLGLGTIATRATSGVLSHRDGSAIGVQCAEPVIEFGFVAQDAPVALFYTGTYDRKSISFDFFAAVVEA
ncbi:MAG: hypothetical protein IPK16_26510 [Anaerolineales bacterium]|nr:hypothetical protein [Anaerolineales bacterium]